MREGSMTFDTPRLRETWNESRRVAIDADHDAVVLENGGDGRRIVIENKIGDLVVDFSTLYRSPSKRALVLLEGKPWMTEEDREVPVVYMPERAMQSPRDLFILLHEIGHIAQNDKGIERYTAPRMAYYRTGTKEAFTDYMRSDVQRERDAWADAIRMARKIKQEHGVDLFALFGNLDEFMGFIRKDGLRTYEAELEKQGEKAYTKDAAVASWVQAEQVEEWMNKEGREDHEVMLFALKEMVDLAA